MDEVSQNFEGDKLTIRIVQLKVRQSKSAIKKEKYNECRRKTGCEFVLRKFIGMVISSDSFIFRCLFQFVVYVWFIIKNTIKRILPSLKTQF